jgi:predicted nuclease of predicted toxin-antitoxin system
VAQLYADEDVPRPVVVALRALGHDVLTVREAGKDGQRIPDHEVLAFACSLGRTVLTKNRRHFVYLHNRTQEHQGIVVFTEDLDYVALAARIDAEIQQRGNLAGELVSVVRPQS